MHNFETYTIDTLELFKQLQQYKIDSKAELLVMDLETDSLIEKKANNYGIGLCFDDTKAFYLPFKKKDGSNYWTKDQESMIYNWIYKTAKELPLVGHNISYDVLVFEANSGIDLTDYIYSDTMLQKHTINENPPHSLKDTAVKYLGEWADKAQKALKENVEENGGRWVKEQKDMYMADTSVLAEYCCFDVILTCKLFYLFEEEIRKQKLYQLFYEEEVMPLYKLVTIPMKRSGFPIDVEHYRKLKEELELKLRLIEDEIYQSIAPDVKDFEQQLLDKEFPVKTTGNFPKALAEIKGIPLPVTKEGKVTMAKKALEKQLEATPDFTDFYSWVINKSEECPLDKTDQRLAQEKLFFSSKKYEGHRHIFNLNSNDQLIDLLVNKWGLKPLSRTDKGKPQVDKDFLEHYQDQHDIIQKLLDFKSLEKLFSTYVVGILNREVDGRLYTSMLQHGTTSGRFASRNPNLNNLPALKEGDESDTIIKYTNSIRAGLTVEEGDLLIGCDFSSLEPHIAAYVTGDEGLIDIFVNNKDFYSAVAMKQFNINDATPFKDGSSNSFPVKYKDLRNLIKAYSLSIFYGATAPKISQMTGKPINECKKLVNDYLKTFPGIKKLITVSKYNAKKKGMVRTKFGRIRHLNEAKELYDKYGDDLLNYQWAKRNNLTLERAKLKNYCNNAINFQIQGMAAHCLNRAMIKMTKMLKKEGLDAQVLLCIHDEVLVRVKKEQVEKVVQIVKYSMETCVNIEPIKLKAEPVVGKNYAECK